ncbi:MAG: translation initiation factor eIF-2B [Candidatus Pacebacteria bacterium]|nr:translation initiation factor eIF-2B [Candidatus Paceibacterota bacterium]
MATIPKSVQNDITTIQDDTESGASQIVKRAVEAFLRLTADMADAEEELFVDALDEVAEKLAFAQPAMAPLFNLVNTILNEEDRKQVAGPIQRRVAEACKNFASGIESSDEAVRRKASGIIRDGDTVFTHSNSSTVLKALLHAASRKKKFEVICTESRPQKEGVALAQALGEAGIPVRFIVDAASGLFVQHANIILVGADTVCEKGLVNKIGTYALALTAAARNVDFYGLCDSSKFLPSGTELPGQAERPAHEILSSCPPGVSAVNVYFDTTPLKYCTGIITENGIIKPEAILQQLHTLKPHPKLQKLIGKRHNRT